MSKGKGGGLSLSEFWLEASKGFGKKALDWAVRVLVSRSSCRHPLRLSEAYPACSLEWVRIDDSQLKALQCSSRHVQGLGVLGSGVEVQVPGVGGFQLLSRDQIVSYPFSTLFTLRGP